MDNKNQVWSEEDFEEKVATGIIACFESKIRKEPIPKRVRILDDDLRFMRRLGLYFPDNNRVIIAPSSSDKSGGLFDTVNDALPLNGCFAATGIANDVENPIKGYVHIELFKRIRELPKPFFARAKGTHYELAIIAPDGKYINGEKSFLTVTPNGEIFAADLKAVKSMGYGRNVPIKQSEHEPEVLRQRELALSAAMQFTADRRFIWSITASEKNAKVTLACTKEEIKSLLYARSLPQTETGRKRPIMHLIESHKRRLRNGTEIDIVPFLKGTQIVDINGTTFTVNAPLKIKPDVSINSQIRYYKDDTAA